LGLARQGKVELEFLLHGKILVFIIWMARCCITKWDMRTQTLSLL
jgi:hypothetical protein